MPEQLYSYTEHFGCVEADTRPRSPSLKVSSIIKPTKIGKTSEVFDCLYTETSAYHADHYCFLNVCAFLLCQNCTQYGDGKYALSVCLY